jgi:taurine dioxygenase
MSHSSLTIRPLDPVGAEVIGLDPDNIGAKRTQELYAAWLEYGILLFRDIDTAERHLALSKCFGELEVHPKPELRAEENPFFFPLGRPPIIARVFDEREVKVGRIPWHRDTAFVPDICKGSMLRAVEARTSEGETLLGDTAAAFDDLPADVKSRLDGLEYKAEASLGMSDASANGKWWKTSRYARDDEYPAGIEPPSEAKDPDYSAWPPVVFPATLRHPESGRMCLFLSPMNVECFLGMSARESDELVDYLIAHMTSPRYVYRHHWAVNDAVIWDNRRFIHAAAGYSPDETRIGLRTTLADRLCVGRHFVESD